MKNFTQMIRCINNKFQLLSKLISFLDKYINSMIICLVLLYAIGNYNKGIKFIDTTFCTAKPSKADIVAKYHVPPYSQITCIRKGGIGIAFFWVNFGGYMVDITINNKKYNLMLPYSKWEKLNNKTKINCIYKTGKIFKTKHIIIL